MLNEDWLFLSNIKFYHQEKWDMTRYVDFDLDRLIKLDWRVAHSYMDYIRAKEALDYNVNNIIY